MDRAIRAAAILGREPIISARFPWQPGARAQWAVIILTAAFFPLSVPSVRAADDDGLREKALALNDITGTAPMEGELKRLLKDEAGTKKLVEEAVKMAKEKQQPFNYTGAFILARAAHYVKNFEAAKVLYKVAGDIAAKLQSASKMVQVYDGQIELLMENKKYEDVIKICKEFLEIDSAEANQVKPFVMESMIKALAKQGKLDEALKLTNELVEADGDDGWYFVRLKAEVYRELGKFDEAIKAYDETLERLERNKGLADEKREQYVRVIRYALSGVFVEDNKIDKAAEQLQILMKKDPDNPTFCNDLGFIWADHDLNLDESEKLIRKAIAEDRKKRKKMEDLDPEDDKDNPAYLDSLGWVLFKKKDFKQAKKYLEEAVNSKEGQNIEILDHLADVQMALGEKQAAIKTWEKALQNESEIVSRRDKERKVSVEKKMKKAQEDK